VVVTHPRKQRDRPGDNFIERRVPYELLAPPLEAEPDLVRGGLASGFFCGHHRAMGRLLTAVIALGVLGYLAYYTLYHRGPSGHETPKQQLENVREKAKDIEANDKKYVDDLEKRTNGEKTLDPSNP